MESHQRPASGGEFSECSAISGVTLLQVPPLGIMHKKIGSPRTSPARKQSLGTEYGSQLWNTHLMQKAISETVNFDRKHIAARADQGVTASFRISAKRQAFHDPSVNSYLCDKDAHSPRVLDESVNSEAVRRVDQMIKKWNQSASSRSLLDSTVDDSRQCTDKASQHSKTSSRSSSIQVHPGIRNRTLSDANITLGIQKLNELARKRNSNSPPRSPSATASSGGRAIRSPSPKGSPRTSPRGLRWPDAKDFDSSFKWPEPKELIAMVQDDVDSRYKHVQRSKSPRGNPREVLPSLPDTKNFVELASPRQSPRQSPRRTSSKASSASYPSICHETVAESWKAHRDASASSDSAFRRISSCDPPKLVDCKISSESQMKPSSSCRFGVSENDTKATRCNSSFNESSTVKEAVASESPPPDPESVTGLHQRIESLLRVARERQARLSSTPTVSRSSSQRRLATDRVGAPNLATAARASSRSARSESPRQQSAGRRSSSSSRRSQMQTDRVAKGAAPPPRVVPFPRRF